MAVKIDLEKAYDRVRWDFVKASLKAAGIPSNLIKIIMNAISTSTVQVLWNGSPTPKFKPVRRIRQMCPLSPYLFILSASTREWCSIRLSHSGPNLLHLFFADDLFIFSKADMKHSGLLKNMLGNFCELSGHKTVLLSIPSYLMQSIWCQGFVTQSKRWQDNSSGVLLISISHRGIKIRRLGNQNKAFMMKIGYSFVTKTEAL
ncbi:Retrovirus-related Pol polyprotein from type-2 retrotransposable element R2DM [Gossypium australe]|uniref:Retrovirus-related Pol polyprotein from type-2 retrotransposable element R2DM n=1 Tax=Gossypium australe TaxID=47621 RepID=A0A5B6W8E8_9ROSI|nr:Retrovirus-related Pol polyprotein from type-2 retrotransposable element R2DM [Gossypium australe]